MTTVRKLLLIFRNNKSEELLNASDSLSFDSFKTDITKPLHEKESTLMGNINISSVVSE